MCCGTYAEIPRAAWKNVREQFISLYLKHYTKPTLATKPDAVITHVGTNDIKNSTPEKGVESMPDLGKDIKQDCGNIELIFSTIITITL